MKTLPEMSLDDAVKRLGISPSKMNLLASWAKCEASKWALKSRLKPFFAEYDEWYAKYGVDINYYVTVDGILKIFGYPVDEHGNVNTSMDKEVLLAQTKVKLRKETCEFDDYLI